MKNKTMITGIVGLLIQGRKESTPGEVLLNLKVNHLLLTPMKSQVQIMKK